MSNHIYVAFVENCRNDNTSYICYLQYDHNEKEINKLYNYIKEIRDYEGIGDMSDFSMDNTMFFSEQTVEETLKLKTYHTCFYKCIGKFVCPIDKKITDDEENNIDDFYDYLHDLFYRCSIIGMFKN